ncbi:hypothetical protein HRbin36_01765 [bacterium HR36]|nr:hypothetical protein HRbin36_01765 [bacterium HR36]
MLSPRLYIFLSLLLFSLATQGCLAVIAGGAAGLAGAAAYEYWKGNVSEHVPAERQAVWQATHAALADLQLPVLYSGTEGEALLIESRSPNDEPIKITLAAAKSQLPQGPARTEVSIRVGTWGDEYLSRRILEQIYARLGQTPAPVHAAASR